jgi:hypothetical protein
MASIISWPVTEVVSPSSSHMSDHSKLANEAIRQIDYSLWVPPNENEKNLVGKAISLAINISLAT